MDMNETKSIPFHQIFHQKIPASFDVETDEQLTVSVQFDQLLIWANRESAGYHLCSISWDSTKIEVPLLVCSSHRYQFTFFPENQDVQTVSVVGDFNNWESNKNQFVKIGEDFVLDLWLPAGTFRYLLEIDSVRVLDPMNPNSIQIQGGEYFKLHIGEARSQLQIISNRYSGGRLLFSVVGGQADEKIENLILLIDNQIVSSENYRWQTQRKLEIILPKDAQFADHEIRVLATDSEQNPLDPVIIPIRNGKPFKKRNKHWFSWRDAIFAKFSNAEKSDSLSEMAKQLGQIVEYANVIFVQKERFTMNEVATISDICKNENCKIIVSVQNLNTEDIGWARRLSSYIDSTDADGIAIPSAVDSQTIEKLRRLSQKHGKTKPFIVLEKSEFGYKEMNNANLEIHSNFGGLSAWWQANHTLQQSRVNGIFQTIDPWRFKFGNHEQIDLRAETFNDSTEITDSLLFKILEEIAEKREKQLLLPLLGLMASASGFPILNHESDEKLARRLVAFCKQNSAFLYGEEIPYFIGDDALLFFRNDFHHTILVVVNLGAKDKEMEMVFPAPFRSLVFRPILETQNPTLYGSHTAKIQMPACSIEFYKARKP